MANKPNIEPFTDSDYEKIEKMAALGLTVDQIASVFDRGRRTFFRLMEGDERLKDVIKAGQTKALIQVTKTAYEMAISGNTPAMTMFYLKCRGRWKEVHHVEHSGEIKTGPDLSNLKTADLKQLKTILEKTKKDEDTEL